MSRRTSHLVTDSREDYRPAKRTEDIVITESRDEVLVYDQNVHHIHHLNPVATAVWKHCDGRKTVLQIVTDTGLSLDAVRLALRELDDVKLLHHPLPAALRSSESRRSFLKKSGIAAIPAIVSITAPIAKAAASQGSGGTCAEPGQTCGLGMGCCGESYCTGDEHNYGTCL